MLGVCREASDISAEYAVRLGLRYLLVANASLPLAENISRLAADKLLIYKSLRKCVSLQSHSRPLCAAPPC